jgi:hypothetical protein
MAARREPVPLSAFELTVKWEASGLGHSAEAGDGGAASNVVVPVATTAKDEATTTAARAPRADRSALIASASVEGVDGELGRRSPWSEIFGE